MAAVVQVVIHDRNNLYRGSISFSTVLPRPPVAYMRMQDLEKFGVEQESIMNGILDDNYKALMKYQIARARFYYKQAARGIPMLAPESRLPVQVRDTTIALL